MPLRKTRLLCALAGAVKRRTVATSVPAFARWRSAARSRQRASVSRTQHKGFESEEN